MFGRMRRNPAAALVLAGLTITAATATRLPAADPPATQPAVGGDAAMPPATQPGGGPVASSLSNPSSPDLRAVQLTLGQLAAGATRPGHAAEFVALLAKANRDAVGPLDPVAWGDVDREIDRFRRTWQGQFGVGFDLNDKEAFVFAEPNVRMLRGGDRAAVLAEAKKLATTPDQQSAIASAPHGATPTSSKAVVLMRAEGSAKPLALFVVSEGADDKGQPAWRVEVPGRMTARTLHDNVLQHLKLLTATRASWPSNIDQAYSFVAHHLLAAVTETSPTRVPTSPVEGMTPAVPAGN